MDALQLRWTNSEGKLLAALGLGVGFVPICRAASALLGLPQWVSYSFTGAHRFYYGRPLSGVIWLLTFGLLGIGWIIDAFLIPGMNDAANRRYRAGRYDYSVAWLLQTFLGPLGIHRLYIGKIGTGILWLFTGGLLGFGWLYDFCTLNEQVDARNFDA